MSEEEKNVEEVEKKEEVVQESEEKPAEEEKPTEQEQQEPPKEEEKPTEQEQQEPPKEEEKPAEVELQKEETKPVEEKKEQKKVNKAPTKRRPSLYEGFEENQQLFRPEFRFQNTDKSKEKIYELMDAYLPRDKLSIQKSIVQHIEYTLASTRFDINEGYIFHFRTMERYSIIYQNEKPKKNLLYEY